MNTHITKKPRLLDEKIFYRQAKQSISANPPNTCSVVSLDFDNFNFVNDLFNYHVGNKILSRIEECFSARLQDGEFFSRLHSDHFVFLIKDTDEKIVLERLEALADLKADLAALIPAHYNLVSSTGIVRVSNTAESLSGLLDKANFARKKAKGNHVNTLLFYTEKMADDIRWQKIITLSMDDALLNREFEMYLQPKLFIKSNEVVGAEALVRWNSSEHGLIFPDRFIPVLEQNGFIRLLDFFMLEEACRFLVSCIKEGLKPLPISVNFSKLHIQDEDFVSHIFETVNGYDLATSLIEIELTESVFSDDFQKLVNVATNLKYLGFKVSLDDFGSAYSSLNYLKDLPLDIIKIDKGFLQSSANSDRGRIIITKVVELIKSLRLTSVMEGVEEKEHVDFLKRLSCDLGQGYYFARPMPVKEYLLFLKNNRVFPTIETEDDRSSRLYAVPEEFQMDNWELYTLGQNIDMGLMKGYLDGEATVQYVNNKALDYLGYTRREFREIFDNSIVAFTHPDDAHIVQANAEQLINSGEPLTFKTRAIRKDGKIIVLQGRSSCVLDNQGRPIGLYAFRDVTEELENEEKYRREVREKIESLEKALEGERINKEALRISQEGYRFIFEQARDILFEWDFESDEISFSEKYNEVFNLEPIQKNLSTNPAIRKRIHPDDLPHFEQWIEHTYRRPGYCRDCYRYRISDRDGQYLSFRVSSRAICDDKGTPVKAIGVFSAID